jgi:azobenzene reductase
MKNIVIISGSIRPDRQSHNVAQFLVNIFNEDENINADLIDLTKTKIPLLEYSFRHHPNPTDSMLEMASKLDAADGVILLSPEYHGSYSGVLKNAVDHFWLELKRKPMGVVAVSAGARGGINASSIMQQLILAIGAFPMPHKLLVPTVKTAFDDAGVPVDSLLRDGNTFKNEFTWFVNAITSTELVEIAT